MSARRTRTATYRGLRAGLARRMRRGPTTAPSCPKSVTPGCSGHPRRPASKRAPKALSPMGRPASARPESPMAKRPIPLTPAPNRRRAFRGPRAVRAPVRLANIRAAAPAWSASPRSPYRTELPARWLPAGPAMQARPASARAAPAPSAMRVRTALSPELVKRKPSTAAAASPCAWPPEACPTGRPAAPACIATRESAARAPWDRPAPPRTPATRAPSARAREGSRPARTRPSLPPTGSRAV
jgi:hypothetical protein